MAVGGSSSGISFGGLASGIDTEGIVNRLIQLETVPVTRLQSRQLALRTTQTIYGQLRTGLSGVSRAASALTTPTAFNSVSATSSDNAVATATVDVTATAGSYKLEVRRLAQANKVSSSAQSDVTTALGRSGTIVVNGKAIQIDAGDSLRGIATKVNTAQTGVTASLINGGTNQSFLTFTASKTGASNAIQMADASGTVLQDLGIVSGSATTRKPVTNGLDSYGLSSATTTVQTLLGGTGYGTGNLTVNGTDIAVDLAADSLQAVADRINQAAITDVSATVVSETVENTTQYRLRITGASATPTLSSTGNLQNILGFTQRASGNELVAAQDSQFSIDGVSLTNAKNEITGVIPGATVRLLKANATTPETTTINLLPDQQAIMGRVRGFVDAINSMVNFIKDNSKLDSKTFQSGPLFGDPLARQVEDAVANLMFNNVTAEGAQYRNLAAVGFSFDQDGKLELDEGRFSVALAANPEAVSNLFRTGGQSSAGNLAFVTAGRDTKPSASAGYEVAITQAATKQVFTAGTAQTGPNTISEKLTFNGALFGNSAYSIDLDVGSTLSGMITKINTDTRLKELLFATNNGGRLQLESRRFGTGGNFTIVSNFSSSTTNSGIGVGGEGTTVAGQNVAGTIGGETATGDGQFLTGTVGNANTAGLQIQVTATAAGTVGNLQFTKGVGSRVVDLLNSFTDSVDGVLTTNDKSLQDQIDALQSQIDGLNTRLASRRTELKTRFSKMEEAIAAAQSQGNRLAALNANNTAR